MKKIFLLLLLSSTAQAACPLFTYPENHKLDQEINNVCDNILNPTINYETVTKAVFNNLSVSTITAVSSETVTNLTVTTKATVPNGSAATDAAAFGQVKLVRISSNTTSTNFTTTANTFQTSNLTYAYATQNTTNSLWILACFTGGGSQSGADHFWDLYADTTPLGNATPGSGHDFLTSGSDHRYPTCLQGFFTPGVSSSVTYSVKARSAGGVSTVYVGSQSALQTITIVEFVK